MTQGLCGPAEIVEGLKDAGISVVSTLSEGSLFTLLNRVGE